MKRPKMKITVWSLAVILISGAVGLISIHYQISHSSGQRYDIVVYNERHEEVYRWSLNKAFTQALIVRDLKQAGEMDFHEEWNLQAL